MEAYIFDVDGTLAETEELHRWAFNQAFEEAGLDWLWSQDDYRELLKTTGGKERIQVYAARTGDSVEVAKLHQRKTAYYVEAMNSGQIELREGVADLIDKARLHDIRLAIATTTSRKNVEALLSATLGTHSISWFEAIVCGEDVARKKPDPEVYHKALQDLGLEPSACIAFEDSYNGLVAAKQAGLFTIITPALYTSDDDFSKADFITDNLGKWTGHVSAVCL